MLRPLNVGDSLLILYSCDICPAIKRSPLLLWRAPHDYCPFTPLSGTNSRKVEGVVWKNLP